MTLIYNKDEGDKDEDFQKDFIDYYLLSIDFDKHCICKNF